MFSYIGIRHNITNLINTEKKLQEQRVNPLTNLLNKYALLNNLKEYQKPVLAIVDIDAFKEINDFFGHNVGDCVLKALANKIKLFFENSNEYVIYKLPIDQYGILLKECEDFQNFENKIKVLLKEINSTSFKCNENEIFITTTAGIAPTSEKLYFHTDLALKEAKNLKKLYLTYKDELELIKNYENNLIWTKKLKKAINDNKIVTFYQPIINNKTKEIQKYESLVRMIDEEDKVISPYFFLDIAKRSKLYSKITKTVFKDLANKLQTSKADFSFNITADDIENDKTMKFLKEKIEEYSCGNRIILEITESEELKDYSKVINIIKEFKELGCKVAIDDFGTGYSNFNYLIDIDADIIKIDGSLIKNLDKDIKSQIIVEAIVSFAKKMKIETVAEFVSSEEIFLKVKEFGIDYSQGFYFGAPQNTIDV